MRDRITLHAAAKINFYLGVGAVRSDGYHELTTVFQSLSLHNRVSVEVVDKPALLGPCVHEVTVSGLGARNVPRDESNLVVRAANQYLTEYVKAISAPSTPIVSIHIDKRIPTAGGMAGGSADAAATLRICQRLFPLPEHVLLEIAAELGADVPFCCVGGTQLGTGKGEQLVPMMSRGEYHLALAFARDGLSTPTVFAKLDSMREEGKLSAVSASEEQQRRNQLASALLSGDARQVAQQLHNDLQPAALSLMPALRTTLEVGRSAGALGGLVSGSGPSVFFLCDGPESALAVRDELLSSGAAYDAAVAHTVGSGVSDEHARQ